MLSASLKRHNKKLYEQGLLEGKKEGIEEGIKKTKGKYTCIVDRVEAIRHAIEMANKKDIIILAGKGHEPYQEIKGVKHPFDEREIVNKIIKGEI